MTLASWIACFLFEEWLILKVQRGEKRERKADPLNEHSDYGMSLCLL